LHVMQPLSDTRSRRRYANMLEAFCYQSLFARGSRLMHSEIQDGRSECVFPRGIMLQIPMYIVYQIGSSRACHPLRAHARSVLKTCPAKRLVLQKTGLQIFRPVGGLGFGVWRSRFDAICRPASSAAVEIMNDCWLGKDQKALRT
jgi:hypothetical protein